MISKLAYVSEKAQLGANVTVEPFAYIADDFYTLDYMARDAGTISYEIMSRVGKNTRYIRQYIGQ